MTDTEKVLCVKKEDILAVGVVPEKDRDGSIYNSSLVKFTLLRNFNNIFTYASYLRNLTLSFSKI